MNHAPPVIQRLACLALRARALEFSAPSISLGDITLLPHQTAATHWLLHRIKTHGGALLADPPGLGKTYVALAVARTLGVTPRVIAPASLRARWSSASRQCGVAIEFTSVERLSSPTPLEIAQPAFVIIDEAHHLRTPATRRHRRTAALCRDTPVLLLSATPIHNATHDLQHITALFHLPPTRASARTLRQRLTLRRSLATVLATGTHEQGQFTIPTLRYRRDLAVPPTHSPLPHLIAQLPTLNGDLADSHRLIQLGLLHALRSSEAAITSRIRRRIAVTLAIEHAARDGVHATADLVRAFQSDDGDVQLAMPLMLGDGTVRVRRGVESAARRQRQALERMLVPLDGFTDRARARTLRRLARWSTRPVVAFTQFTATAVALYRCLRDRPGIAWLAGSSAHITSGVITREEAIERLLAPRYRDRHDGVRLLITTDVVSEGLSLDGVAIVVHLDRPWTAARLDQRIGRAARIGAGVPVVHIVHLPAPFAGVHDAVQALVTTKRQHMHLIDGDPHDADDARTVRLMRRLWAGQAPTPRQRGWLTATTTAVRDALILAEVRVPDGHWLVAVDASGVRRTRPDDWAALVGACASATFDEVTHPSSERRHVLQAVRVHLAGREVTARVSDARDPRLVGRRVADAQLLQGDRTTRGTQAATVSSERRRVSRYRHRGVRVVCAVALFPEEKRPAAL